MPQKPLLLADEWLLGVVQDIDLPVALVSMQEHLVPRHTLPPVVEVLDRKQALAGLQEGRFSRLLMSPRRGPFWDKQRPFVSRVWEMRKKIGDESLLRQYAIPKAALACGVPMTVVDFSDTFHIAEWDHPLLQAAETYWFREMPIHPYHLLLNTSRRFRRYSNISKNPLMREMHKVQPISLGLSDARQKFVKAAAKRHDIFFSGADTGPARVQARQILQRLKAGGEFQIYLPETTLSQEDFYQACAESHVVVSPSGWGWDCYRHYEAGLCASVPVMNYPTIRRYRPFIDGEHGFYYDLEGDGLERCLRKILSDKTRLVEMGQRARAHVLEYHLFSKLLRLVLKETA